MKSCNNVDLWILHNLHLIQIILQTLFKGLGSFFQGKVQPSHLNTVMRQMDGLNNKGTDRDWKQHIL